MVLEYYEIKEEQELENVLVSDIEQIEEGLKVIGSQIRTSKGEGRLDILCLDADNILTIIELKNKVDESQLQQAMTYFNWTLENLYWIKDAYKIQGLEETTPRIVLIAPEFSDALLNEAKYLSETVAISLLTFSSFKINGKIEVVFNPIKTSEISEIQDKPKEIKDHYEFITDSSVREIMKWAQDEITKWSADIKPHATKFGIVMKYRNKNFCGFYPRRTSFTISYKEKGSWEDIRGIKTEQDAGSTINTLVKESFSLVGGKLQESQITSS